MAFLTTEEKDTLWDGRFVIDFCYNDKTTQDSNTFHCIKVDCRMDGQNYYSILTENVDHDSDLAAIETAFKAQTIEKKEAPQHSKRSIDLN